MGLNNNKVKILHAQSYIPIQVYILLCVDTSEATRQIIMSNCSTWLYLPYCKFSVNLSTYKILVWIFI